MEIKVAAVKFTESAFRKIFLRPGLIHDDFWDGIPDRYIQECNHSTLFTSLNPRELSDLAGSSPDLARWIQVEIPTHAIVEEFITHLASTLNDHYKIFLNERDKEDCIEACYLLTPGFNESNRALDREAPEPKPDGQPPHQEYLGPASTKNGSFGGIDARYAWEAGIKGSDVNWADIEVGWQIDHEDFPEIKTNFETTCADLRDKNVRNAYGDRQGAVAHGTETLGVVLMQHNAVGGHGGAPGSHCQVISTIRRELRNGEWLYKANPADAIAVAICRMQPGDILLLEITATAYKDDNTRGLSWPAEVRLATYDLLLCAYKRNICVIEPAGNMTHDLDSFKNSSESNKNRIGAYWSGKKIFDRKVRDSKAIFVGAGEPEHPHNRRSPSPTGDRIDCFAWGGAVYSTSISGNHLNYYTKYFDGTSSAAAIVTVAAIIVQAIARSKHGKSFSPDQIRRILIQGGTVSKNNNGVKNNIGVMPNLRSIIDEDCFGEYPILEPA